MGKVWQKMVATEGIDHAAQRPTKKKNYGMRKEMHSQELYSLSIANSEQVSLALPVYIGEE